MSEIIVHLGAHRTGTTALQQFLQRHQAALASRGIGIVCPPASRKGALTRLRPGAGRLLVSEENLMGTMEENIREGCLYPSIGRQLARHAALITAADVVYLSIRNTADWWVSAIAFCAARDLPLVGPDQMATIARASRSWTDVVEEVRQAAPEARLIVREFGWKPDNPKQQLIKATRWPEWTDLALERRSHNARPGFERMAEAFAARGDQASLARLEAEGLPGFTSRDRAALEAAYAADVTELARRDDIELWQAGAPAPARRPEAPSFCPDPVRVSSARIALGHVGAPKTCILHIGKTHGAVLRAALKRRAPEPARLLLCAHADTIATTAQKYGPERRLGFVFRNPADRFVSALRSRSQQGRAASKEAWSGAEAEVFGCFDTPNALAEALDASDEARAATARLAFQALYHLRHGYVHYLGAPRSLRREHEAGRVLFCCETPHLEQHLPRILNRLEIADAPVDAARRQGGASSSGSTLSERAQANLRRHWAGEYEIYRACREVARDLGFG